MKQYRSWTKLTVVTDNATHLIAALSVRKGPSNDAPDFIPAVSQAVGNLRIGRLLADGAYDAEENHRFCREELGVSETVIPVNSRGFSRLPHGRYRKRMARRFPRRVSGQRWQVESVISRMKRRLGEALRSRTESTRQAECCFRVLTHDIMIL
jgi:hypothetical protein